MTSSVLRLLAISFLIVLAGWWLWSDQPHRKRLRQPIRCNLPAGTTLLAVVWELADLRSRDQAIGIGP